MFCTRKLFKFVDSVYRIDKKSFKCATITEIAAVINQYNYTRSYSLGEVFDLLISRKLDIGSNNY